MTINYTGNGEWVTKSAYRETPTSNGVTITPKLLIQAESVGNTSPYFTQNYNRTRVVQNGAEIVNATASISCQTTTLRLAPANTNLTVANVENTVGANDILINFYGTVVTGVTAVPTTGAGTLGAGTYYISIRSNDTTPGLGKFGVGSLQISATLSSAGKITVSWSRPGNADQYRVYISTTSFTNNSSYYATTHFATVSNPSLTFSSSIGTANSVWYGSSFIEDSTARFYNSISITDHGLWSGTSIACGMGTTQTYYVIRLTKHSFQLASTYQDAISSTPIPIDLPVNWTVSMIAQTLQPMWRVTNSPTVWNTWGSITDANNLLTFLDNIVSGDMLIFTTYDEPTSTYVGGTNYGDQYTRPIWNSLVKYFGSKNTNWPRVYRDSHLLVGIKNRSTPIFERWSYPGYKDGAPPGKSNTGSYIAFTGWIS